MPLFQKGPPKGSSSAKIAAKLASARTVVARAQDAFATAVAASVEAGDEWTAEVAAAETKLNKAKAEVARFETAHADALRADAKQAAERAEAERDKQDARTVAAAEDVAKQAEVLQAAIWQASEAFRLMAAALDAFSDQRAINPRVRSDLMASPLAILVSEEMARVHHLDTPFLPGLSKGAWNLRRLDLRPLATHFADLAATVRSSLTDAKAQRARTVQP